MDLRQIQYFIALFEDGSVTRAARRLNIVQPALSMQIGRLEEELGQRLFERGPHGMSPTAAGRRMYRLYLPIMRDIAVARQQMVQQDEMVAGHVSIGVIASITESVMADALLTFHRRYPNVEVSVSDGYLQISAPTGISRALVTRTTCRWRPGSRTRTVPLIPATATV